MDKQHCSGCRNDFYNGRNPHEIKECWSLKEAVLVKRIRIGNWENPPYLKKKAIQVPICYHTESGGDHFIDPDKITKKGFWK